MPPLLLLLGGSRRGDRWSSGEVATFAIIPGVMEPTVTEQRMAPQGSSVGSCVARAAVTRTGSRQVERWPPYGTPDRRLGARPTFRVSDLTKAGIGCVATDPA
jgi:hypothetical protein